VCRRERWSRRDMVRGNADHPPTVSRSRSGACRRLGCPTTVQGRRAVR
jgi:hypothetical protein